MPAMTPPGAEDFSDDATLDVRLTQTPAYLSSLLPFRSLNEEILALLGTGMTERLFRPGETLMAQGDPGDSLMVIAQGEVEVSVVEEGKRHLLKRAHEGEILGEMALLTHEPRTASVTAITPVRALVLPAVRFEELAAEHPRISSLLTLLLASRLGSLQHDALTGLVFHGYRIRQCLGQGGMSVVYEADERATGRRVALKMMSHRLLYDQGAMKRFRREFEIVSGFDHPNIAKTWSRFEAFRTSFIVMEFCEGTSLDAALRSRGRLPEPAARGILGQIARAVAHAHEAGVVHRDLKPSNIMISSSGHVKLIDFGLAGYDDDVAGLGVAGTPRYMAPEQMAGGRPGKKTDLFALGLIAWEMAAGSPLFRSEGLRALMDEVGARPLPPVEEDPPGLSVDYRSMLRDLLQRDPSDRRFDVGRITGWAAPVEGILEDPLR